MSRICDLLSVKKLTQLFAAILLSSAFACQATMTEGLIAYQQQNYAQALVNFQQVAHIGNVKGQLKVASMYEQGQGVEQDLLQSALYYALAADNQNKHAQSKLATLLDHLSHEQSQQYELLWPQLQRQYGRAAMARKSVPAMLDKVVRISAAIPVIGEHSVSGSVFALRHSKVASLILEYDIGRDGKVRDIEIVKNMYMAGVNTQRILDTMAERQFIASHLASNRKHKVTLYNERSIWGKRDLERHYVQTELPKVYHSLKKLEDAAAQGHAYSQYDLAMMYRLFPNLQKDPNADLYFDYIESAAKAGVVEALLEYADILLRGELLPRNYKVAMALMHMAAKSGYARAQYKLGRKLLEGRIVQRDEKKALFWLQQAAEQDDGYAKFWLARLYLTAEDTQLRQPSKADALLDEVEHSQRNNPNWYYYQALADFALKDKAQALDRLNKGYAMAADLKWDLTPFVELQQQQSLSQ